MSYKKNPHFLFVGHSSSHNRGCEALIRSAVIILREQFPGAKVTVAASYPEHEASLMYDITNLQIIPGYNKISNVVGSYTFSYALLNCINYLIPRGVLTFYARKIGFKPILPQLRPKSEGGFLRVNHLKKAMLEADAVILLCGDLYNVENYSTSLYTMEVMEYAQLLRCKTIIWSASIWKFKRKWIEKRIKDILVKTDLIVARDVITVDYLFSLGIKKNVVLGSDCAFLLPRKKSIRTTLPWMPKPPLVIGLNGSDLICYYLTKRKYRKFIADIVYFCQFLVDNFGCHIVFIPHDGHPGAQERDFLFEIELMVNRQKNVYMIPVGLDATEIKDVIGQCDVFIGMRYHPTIASLSQLVPTLSMYYSQKFIGLHKFIFGHTDHLIHYKEVSYDLLILKFKQILKNKSEIQLYLEKRIPELQTQCRLVGRYLKELL